MAYVVGTFCASAMMYCTSRFASAHTDRPLHMLSTCPPTLNAGDSEKGERVVEGKAEGETARERRGEDEEGGREW